MLNAKNRFMQKVGIAVLDTAAATAQRAGIIYPVNPDHPVTHPDLNEIIGKFGGPDRLRTAVNQLQSLIYAE